MFYRDINVLDGSNSDRDDTISNDLIVKWEKDLFSDEDGTGFWHDWVISTVRSNPLEAIWDEPKETILKVRVCDGMELCDEAKSMSQFFLSKVLIHLYQTSVWMNEMWASEAGSDALGCWLI